MNQLLAHVDVAVVAGLSYYLVQTALKPLVARFVAHAAGVAFDAIVPLLLVLVAGGLICLDVWAPVAFQVAEMAAGIATMSVGGYRISQNQMPTKKTAKKQPIPAAPVTPAPVTDPAAPSA